MKRQIQTGRKYLQKKKSDKGLLLIVENELLKLNNKKANDPIKNEAKDHNEEEIYMANKHVKRFSTSHHEKNAV